MENELKRCVGIDWITATVLPSWRAEKLQDLGETPVHSWVFSKPSNGYNRCRVSPFGTRYQWHSTESRMGHSLVFSGSVLQSLRSVGVSDLDVLRGITTEGARLSRIDVALDLVGGREVDTKLERLMKGASGAKRPPLIVQREGADFNAQFGSRASETFIRVYNKRVEQKADFDWFRIECELKAQRAVQAQDIITRGGHEAMMPLLKTTLERGIKKVGKEFWDLVGGEAGMDLTMARRETDTRAWLMKFVVPALVREISAEDGDEFFREFWAEVDRRASEKKP